ncbi:methyltransferase, FxLD system [Streptomyces sp. NA02950]|uniref:methyltransferase, FxLD system n=1 Tax=Streptomyces sp. NA02950 TaxID=2742137 RepID=UPI0020CB4FAF|nr:methyltransferase, FxLD system [Streptomyces sp. NA02950]
MDDEAASLRAAMVRELHDLGAITSETLAGAVATVPRHLFAVDEPLKAAYAADQALVIKRDQDGTALSSLSATHIQVVMLEQAEIEPGMRVLEVGSGGYNAALIAELVGDTGAVVSVDIDAEIVERARTCLDAAGYEQVEVVQSDADAGVPEHAPFDRIIVTAGAWDIPSAWLDQLSEHGRIVVPLRMRGLTRSIAFDRADEGLVSDSYRLCGFVAMQGAGAYTERLIRVADGIGLRVDDQRQDFDINGLAAAVRSPGLEVWSGAAFDLPDELELFLATSTPEMAMLHGSKDLVEQGVFALSVTRGVPALVVGGSFAYRTKRPNQETGGFESGVFAHGPDAEAVAARYIDLLRRWASEHQRRGAARIRYRPMPSGTAKPSQGIVAKQLGAVEISWS